MGNAVGGEFKLRQVRHMQLVCKDIARTAIFYRDALGMRLVGNFDLPDGAGRRVVFDVGDGASLAFLWFRSARPARRCDSHSLLEPRIGARITAGGSIGFIRLEVSADRFDEYRRHMKDRGVPVSLAFHGGEPRACAGELAGHTASRCSLFCLDPDGVSLEITRWTTPSVRQPRAARELTITEGAAGRRTEPALAFA